MNRPPNPDTGLPATRLLSACTPGKGEVIASAAGVPEFSPMAAAVGELPSDWAFLTPHTETPLHPLGAYLGPSDFYRGTNDLRSFSLVTADVPGAGSLSIKGGDLPWMHVASGMGLPTAGERIQYEQIPGAGLTEELKREFEMASYIQHTAVAALGRLTFTAIPLRVNTITAAQTRAGTMVDLRAYLNSPENYFAPTQYQVRDIDMKGGGLGDLIVGRYGLQAAEYLYMTPGLNVRVSELVNSRYIRTFDDDSYNRHEDLFSQVINDVIADYGACELYGKMPGDDIAVAPDRKDTVFRRVYGLLADAYGFDTDEVLPSNPITDGNYMHYLSKIPRICERKGIAKRVLEGFTHRVTEVAALLHAQEKTYSTDVTGGSLVSRNVTYDGTVLDLDTAGDFTREPESHIVQDYSEMALTIAVLRRAVSDKQQVDLPQRLRSVYREKLEMFGAEGAWIDRIDHMLDADETLAGITDRAF